jgi:DNA-binding response OmpR family regulator
VSSARLIDYAWGYHGADAAMLKMHVSRIRQKLASRGLHSARIESVRWVGYVLRDAGPNRDGQQPAAPVPAER